MTTFMITDYETGDTLDYHQDDGILKSAEAVGISYEYRTRAGADYSTIAKVFSGLCEAEDTGFLSPFGLSEGFILIDVACPLTDFVINFVANTGLVIFQIIPPAIYES